MNVQFGAYLTIGFTPFGSHISTSRDPAIVLTLVGTRFILIVAWKSIRTLALTDFINCQNGAFINFGSDKLCQGCTSHGMAPGCVSTVMASRLCYVVSVIVASRFSCVMWSQQSWPHGSVVLCGLTDGLTVQCDIVVVSAVMASRFSVIKSRGLNDHKVDCGSSNRHRSRFCYSALTGSNNHEAEVTVMQWIASVLSVDCVSCV